MKKYIIILLVFTACNTPKYAAKQIGKQAAMHPQVLAEICARNYPVNKKDSIVKIRIPGEKIFIPGDTVTIDCDSVVNSTMANKGKSNSVVPNKVKVPCPPSSHTVDTQFVGEYIVKENTALADSYRLKYENVNKAYTAALKKSAALTKYLMIVGLVAVALLVILIFIKR